MNGLKLIEVKDNSPDVNDLMYEVMLEGRQIGQAYLYRSEDGEVTLDDLYVEREERTARLLRQVYLDMIGTVQRDYGANSITTYEHDPDVDEDNDRRFKIARSVLGLHVERRDYGRKFYVSMEPTARQNHERLYTAERLEREGYTFMSWAQCDDAVRQQLEGLRGETEATGLIWLPTDFPQCDGDLTLIGLYKGEVCAWMIFERLSEDEADCKRWYAVEKFRRQSAGVKVSGHFFRHVLEHCRKLQFNVRNDHGAVMKFHRQFFKDAIEKVDHMYRYHWSCNR